jgi:N-acetyl-gamma-glutamylphosphate reductase
MNVIFPDIEKVLVAAFKTTLATRSEPYAQNVLVSTVKPAPDVSPYPSRIITIRGDGGPELDYVRKQERVGITIWADTYSDASSLARLIEALVKGMTGEAIKLVEINLSPVRVDEAGPQECRYITIQCITKGIAL